MTSPQPQDLALLHLKIKVKETTKEIVISTRNSPQDRRTTTETGKQTPTQTHSSPTNRENSATTTTTSTNHNNNTMINDSNGFRFRPYSEYTIYNLKEDYFTKELQEQKRIRLLYAGKELRDESFVKDCNLHDNAVLHAVITQYNPESHSNTWNNNDGVHGGSPNENNNIFEGFRRRGLGSGGGGGGMNNNGNSRRSSRTTMNGNPSSNLQQRRIEGYIFFFLSFIFLFIIWWARYMYPEAFSKMSINILGVVTGIYILSLLHFIL